VFVSGKNCRICGELKPLDDFYRMADMRDGHRNECKECNLAQKKQRYLADPAKYIAMVERWRKANPEQHRAYRNEYQARPERKRKQRDAYYRRTFGISADEFDALLAGQSGGCAICGSVPERAASLHLDHDHLTGDVRGILCLSCNQGVGKFRDDPALLEKAARYVRGGRAT
jgi:hypothetical protein